MTSAGEIVKSLLQRVEIDPEMMGTDPGGVHQRTHHQ